jgi:hypothetical protein
MSSRFGAEQQRFGERDAFVRAMHPGSCATGSAPRSKCSVAALHVGFGRSFEAQDAFTEVVASRIADADSCDLRSNPASTNPFLHHPQKKYLTAGAATSLTAQALELRD